MASAMRRWVYLEKHLTVTRFCINGTPEFDFLCGCVFDPFAPMTVARLSLCTYFLLAALHQQHTATVSVPLISDRLCSATHSSHTL